MDSAASGWARKRRRAPMATDTFASHSDRDIIPPTLKLDK